MVEFDGTRIYNLKKLYVSSGIYVIEDIKQREKKEMGKSNVQYVIFFTVITIWLCAYCKNI